MASIPSTATFSAWTERLKAYNEYLKALGQYKKDLAEAAIKRAQAAQQWEKARAMKIVLKQLDRAMKALNGEINRNKKEVAAIRGRQNAAEYLLKGKPIPTAQYSFVWRAYEWFESRALIEAEGDLYSIPIPSAAKSSNNFLKTDGDGSDCNPAPDDVDTVIALMAWLRDVRYVVRRGSPAHQSLVALFKAINEVAENTVKELDAHLEAIRKGTYEAWKPASLIGIPTSATATALQEAGQNKSA